MNCPRARTVPSSQGRCSPIARHQPPGNGGEPCPNFRHRRPPIEGSRSRRAVLLRAASRRRHALGPECAHRRGPWVGSRASSRAFPQAQLGAGNGAARAAAVVSSSIKDADKTTVSFCRRRPGGSATLARNSRQPAHRGLPHGKRHRESRGHKASRGRRTSST